MFASGFREREGLSTSFASLDEISIRNGFGLLKCTGRSAIFLVGILIRREIAFPFAAAFGSTQFFGLVLFLLLDFNGPVFGTLVIFFVHFFLDFGDQRSRGSSTFFAGTHAFLDLG